MTAPGTIEHAIAGTYGPVNRVMRYETRDVNNVVQRDITAAVSGGSYEVDVFREVPSRISGLLINESRLDYTIDWSREFLAPFIHLGWGEDTVIWQVGLFVFGEPQHIRTEASVVWSVAAGDMCERLARARTRTAYRVRNGQNLLNSAAFLCSDVGLRFVMEGAENVEGKSYTWPPGTSYLTIVNAIALMAGCYPVWADRDGVIHTRRLDISVSTDTVRTFEEGTPGDGGSFFTGAPDPNATVEWIGPFESAVYRTDAEPRLLRTPLIGHVDPQDRANVAIGEGLNMQHVVVGNADERSVLYPLTVGSERPIDLMVSTSIDTLLDHAGWQLVLAEALANEHTIETAIDPRIEGRPYYRTFIDSANPLIDVQSEFWVSLGWSFSLTLSGNMRHRIGKMIRDLRMAAYIVEEFTEGEDFSNGT